MRIMGLDVGDRKIGVAISDELNITAQGLEVIERYDDEHVIKRFSELIEKYEVDKIIIGLPKNMNGTLGPQSEKVKALGNEIEERLNIKIEYWDERLSTIAAEKTLIKADMSRKKRKKIIDKVAAIIILQNYLDYKF